MQPVNRTKTYSNCTTLVEISLCEIMGEICIKFVDANLVFEYTKNIYGQYEGGM